MTIHVCPLGLCTFESVCPRAPCIECMRRLGEHMIQEMKLLGTQADVATSLGKHNEARDIQGIMDHLGETLGMGENFRAAKNAQDVKEAQHLSASAN